MTIVAGADVGGTKTVALVGMPDAVAGRATGPGAAVRPGRALASVSPIAECVRQALAGAGVLRCKALVVGAAGAGHPTDRTELAQALRIEDLADQIRVTTDLEIAVVAAFGNAPGIVVASGTGSAAVARDRDGVIHRGGGYGWQMGDEGSGYALGRAALGAVGWAQDGRGPATALTAALLAVTRTRDFNALVRWAATAAPGAVASLALPVLEAAKANDSVAESLVEVSARDLVRLAESMLAHFEGEVPVAIALHGGMLRAGMPLRDRVAAAIQAHDRFAMVDHPVEPAQGALTLAAALAAG